MGKLRHREVRASPRAGPPAQLCGAAPARPPRHLHPPQRAGGHALPCSPSPQHRAVSRSAAAPLRPRLDASHGRPHWASRAGPAVCLWDGHCRRFCVWSADPAPCRHPGDLWFLHSRCSSPQNTASGWTQTACPCPRPRRRLRIRACCSGRHAMSPPRPRLPKLVACTLSHTERNAPHF